MQRENLLVLAATHVGLKCVPIAAYHVTQLTVVVSHLAFLWDILLLLETLLVVLALQVGLVGLQV